jgi:hypothetical protein
MLKAFDAPTREECTAARPRSNTAIAALVLLNDPTFVEAARVFAERTMNEGGSTFDEQLTYCFQWVVSRNPLPFERDLLHQLWQESYQIYSSDEDAARKLLSVGQAPVAGDRRPELAAWTVIARVLFNLDEAITRS